MQVILCKYSRMRPSIPHRAHITSDVVQTRFSSRTSYPRGVRTFTLCGEENKLVLICKSAQKRFVGVLTLRVHQRVRYLCSQSPHER